MSLGAARLAHGWRLVAPPAVDPAIVAYLRPAVRAVPRAIAARLKACRISLFPELADGTVASQWTVTGDRLEISLAVTGTEPHDLAMELLTCVGQALWEATGAAGRKAYLESLRPEIEASVPGEIDEDALREKRRLLSSPASARSARRLNSYARASFASTVAEYIHCLWHDVTIRAGPDHLPQPWLRRRLEMLSRWFPPDRGHRLFPPVR